MNDFEYDDGGNETSEEGSPQRVEEMLEDIIDLYTRHLKDVTQSESENISNLDPKRIEYLKEIQRYRDKFKEHKKVISGYK